MPPLLVGLLACGAHRDPPPTPPTTIEAPLGDAAYLTPLDAPLTVALTGGGSLPADAKACGACHSDHYAEWSGSTHARATRDLQYLAELAKPDQPRWLCLNCHAPTRPQRWERVALDSTFADPSGIARLVSEPEPSYDPLRTAEGVSCATCHVRRDPDGEGVIVGPRGSGRAPHRVRLAPEALTGTCVGCHSPGPAKIRPTLVCWFETAEEVAAGPTPDAGCSTCHMPSGVRPAALGGEPLALRRHLWLGGGVPKDLESYDRLAREGWEPAVDLGVSLGPVTVTLTNSRAAHAVPTGDPERHLWVEARVERASGEVLGRDTLRIGQQWDWGDEATGRWAHRLADNRMLPGEVRSWSPNLPAGGDRLVVEVSHVRLLDAYVPEMAGATLDGELLLLWPEGPALLPEIGRRYPRRTLIARTRVDLSDGAATATPIAELLAESQQAASELGER